MLGRSHSKTRNDDKQDKTDKKLTLEEIQLKTWELICAFYSTVSYPSERKLIINNNLVLNMYAYFVSYITMTGDCQSK